MNILVDTHIALWAITEPDLLMEWMKELLCDEQNTFFYSIVSVWEVAIKHKAHPENMVIAEEEFERVCLESGFRKIELSSEHIYTVKTLVYPEDAPRHKDPFDRLLLSQAISEGMKFLTADQLIPNYHQDCVLKG